METILRYNKAIAAAVGAVVAMGFVLATGDAGAYATTATAIAGAVTTFFVYLIPNKE